MSTKKINDYIEKALDSGELSAANGGELQPEQANEFIQMVVDETKLIDMVNQRIVDNPKGEMARINMNQPVTYGATEGEVPTQNEAGPSFDKLEYSTTKLISWMDITREVGETNITGSWEAFKQQLMNSWSDRIANDHELLAIQGNEEIDTGGSADNNPYTRLLENNDGFLKLIDEQSPNVIDWNGEPFDPDVFAEAIKNLPTQYAVDVSDFRFLSSYLLEQEVRNYWEERGTSLGDRLANDEVSLTPRGITLDWIPHWPNSTNFLQTDFSGQDNVTHLLLTNPTNLDYIISRELENYMEFVPRSDSYEGTFYSKTDYMVEEPEATVLIKNIDVS